MSMRHCVSVYVMCVCMHVYMYVGCGVVIAKESDVGARNCECG